jgi:outer membrane immunogenic protein
MRRVLLAVAMFAMAPHAHAADMPDFLRGSLDGSATTVNWQGYYVGGQGVWASSTQTFSGSTMDHSVFANLISGSTVSQISGIAAPTPLGTSSKGSAGYGAFTGYNWQWTDVILGVEMSYLHGSFGGGVSAARQFASSSALTDGLFHNPTVTSTSTFAVTDYATFRARAAYAYNCFLPYAFGGFALGYADVSTSARIDDFVSPVAGGPFTASSTLIGTHTGENHLIYGYTAGLGIDINLMAGLFVRAEWEYVRFTQQVDANINTLRLGLGYKF